MNKFLSIILLLGVMFVITPKLFAQIDVSSFPGECGDPKPSHFAATTLVRDMDQPSEIDIAGDGRIFYTERVKGNLWVYDPADTQSHLVLNFEQVSKQEFGLVSVALDPKFNHNKWLYIWHSPVLNKEGQTINDINDNDVRMYLLERFTLIGNEADVSTRKTILAVPFQQSTHNGASMRFGPNGLFYLGTGDNAGAEAYGPNRWQNNSRHDGGMTTANTNDLRGKILRLKLIAFEDTQNPEPGIGTTYEIPEGNLVDKYAEMYTENELAKIRPEIYTMGHRNVYRINVDENGWVLFGENGPGAASSDPNQGPNGFDEWNVATSPTFFGWPFFNGEDQPFRPYDMVGNKPMTNEVYDALPGAHDRNGYDMSAYYDVENPINLSPRNTGVIKMPPIKAAVAGMPRGNSGTDPFPQGINSGLGYCTPLGGPVFRYHDYYDISGGDPSKPSKVKFPPWFDGRWVFYDDVSGHWMLVEMDSTGNSIDKIYNAPITRGDFAVNRVLDMEIGPDGALYLMNYGGGNEHSGNENASIVRVDYIGPSGTSSECYLPDSTYLNPNFIQEPPGVVEGVGFLPGQLVPSEVKMVNLMITTSIVIQAGAHLELFGLQGSKIWEARSQQNHFRVKIPNSIPRSVVYTKVSYPNKP